MNKAKSVFIVLFLLLINLSLLHVATMSWHSPLGAGWMGVFVLALPNFYLFVWMFMRRRARTSRNLHLLMATNLMGIALVLTDPGMEANPWPLVIGNLLFFGSIAYIFWYSHLGDRSNAMLNEGEKLPMFELTTLEGNVFTSEQFKGSAWLLIFYRGNWCPLCMTQIGEVAGRYIDLDRLGVKVALISPQPEHKTLELAKRFDVPMQFFVDADFKASKKLNLVHANGVPFGLKSLGHGEDTALPTVLMINKHGRIVYSDQTSNYRVRPQPEQFLEVARQKLASQEG
ncbi:peroxiredoxin family protein [Limnobacter parvus]|uniref:Redoxin domain-containing protein n=1 Tax=Limnobacter parvus TaxID=2939690 RepID=A0ABT1XG53_9BURK|nr:redoxin domain-containing protein [Limnobacter parvus]MCR2746276.1 redoxin domain-containing protein [Limnobacter parvus]